MREFPLHPSDLHPAVRRYVERISTIEKHVFDRVFTIVLLLFVSVILVIAPRYDPRTQLFPLLIGVPIWIIVFALLVIQSSPTARSAIHEHVSTDLLEGNAHENDERPVEVSARVNLLRILSWLGAFLLGIWVLGFRLGLPLVLLAFYRIEAEQPWHRAVLDTAVITGFILVIFDVWLRVSFHRGIFGV